MKTVVSINPQECSLINVKQGFGADVRQNERLASVSPQTCDKSKVKCLEMKFCKSKTSLTMHVFLSIWQDVKKRVILRGDFENNRFALHPCYIL